MATLTGIMDDLNNSELDGAQAEQFLLAQAELLDIENKRTALLALLGTALYEHEFDAASENPDYAPIVATLVHLDERKAAAESLIATLVGPSETIDFVADEDTAAETVVFACAGLVEQIDEAAESIPEVAENVDSVEEIADVPAMPDVVAVTETVDIPVEQPVVPEPDLTDAASEIALEENLGDSVVAVVETVEVDVVTELPLDEVEDLAAIGIPLPEDDLGRAESDTNAANIDLDTFLTMPLTTAVEETESVSVEEAPVETAAATAATCASCGTVLEDDMKFCPTCGTPVTAQPQAAEAAAPANITCPSCGTEAQPGDLFCMNCGQRLNGSN